VLNKLLSISDFQDNSEELREKLMKNREKLFRLLDRVPNLVAAEASYKNTRNKTTAEGNID